MNLFDRKSYKRKVKCKKCGGEAIADTEIVLTSNPPMYNVDCPNCGRIYMFCSEVNRQLL